MAVEVQGLAEAAVEGAMVCRTDDHHGVEVVGAPFFPRRQVVNVEEHAAATARQTPARFLKGSSPTCAADSKTPKANSSSIAFTNT